MTDLPVEAVPDPIESLAVVMNDRAEKFVLVAHALMRGTPDARDFFVELMRAYRIGARDMHAEIIASKETA